VSAWTDSVDALAGCACTGTVRPALRFAGRAAQAAAQAGELPFFAPPAAMQARVEQVLGELSRTEQAIARFAPPPPTAAQFEQWRQAFASFAADFRSYASKIDWFDKAFGAAAAQIETYAAQLDVWQTQFRDFGGYLPGVTPPGPSVLKAIAIGVAAGLTTAAIVWVLKPNRPIPVVLAPSEVPHA